MDNISKGYIHQYCTGPLTLASYEIGRCSIKSKKLGGISVLTYTKLLEYFAPLHVNFPFCSIGEVSSRKNWLNIVRVFQIGFGRDLNAIGSNRCINMWQSWLFPPLSTLHKVFRHLILIWQCFAHKLYPLIKAILWVIEVRHDT